MIKMKRNRTLFCTAIILLGSFISSCRTTRTFKMNNSQNPLYYHDAFWVARIKPEGAPAKITVINDMYIDTVTNRVTVYAQSKIGGKIVSPPHKLGQESVSKQKTIPYAFILMPFT